MEQKTNKFNNRRQAASEIDTDHVIRYLTRQFKQKTEDHGKAATRGTDLHKLQVDFAYMLDGIKRGPTYQVSKIIANANAFLDNITINT